MRSSRQWMDRYSRRAGHISPAGVTQRSRCESGAVPQLRCLRSGGDEPGRLLSAVELSPRRKGGSRGSAAGPPPSASRGGFLWSEAGSPGRSPWRLSSSRRRGRRHRHRGGDPDPDRLALADGDRGSVRDRRRQAGRRGRRPVELPGERAEDEALRLHAERRGDRRLQARPRRRLVRRQPHRRGAREAEHPGAPRADRLDASPTPTRRSRSSGKATGHAAGAAAVVARMKRQIAAIVASVPHGDAAHLLRGARARPLLGHVEDVHRPHLHAARPEGHRRRGRQDRLRLPAALGGVHRRGGSRPDRPRRHDVLRPDGGKVEQARPAGARSRRSRTAASSP